MSSVEVVALSVRAGSKTLISNVTLGVRAGHMVHGHRTERCRQDDVGRDHRGAATTVERGGVDPR